MIDKTQQDSLLISAWLLTIGILRSEEGLPVVDNSHILSVLNKIISLENGMSINDYLDIYDIPGEVFDLCENHNELKNLNIKYSGLNKEFKKLLNYIVSEYDVKNICLSMGYDDQDLFWEKKDECLQQLTGSKDELPDSLKSGYKKIIEKYFRIRDVFLEVTDGIDAKAKQEKSKRKWLLLGSMSLIITLLFFILIFPLLIQKDYEVLFDYGVGKSGYIMSIDSTELLDEMIIDAEQYSPEYHWLLSLKALHNGDSRECRNQLKELKSSDPVMFNNRGRYIIRRLKR